MLYTIYVFTKPVQNGLFKPKNMMAFLLLISLELQKLVSWNLVVYAGDTYLSDKSWKFLRPCSTFKDPWRPTTVHHRCCMTMDVSLPSVYPSGSGVGGGG